MLKKILFIISGLIGVIIIIGTLIYVLSGMCTINYVTDKIYSPDGNYYVRVQHTSCGGAAGRSTTDVVITNAKNSILNFFNGNFRKGITVVAGPNALVIPSWNDNRTVKVKYSKCLGTYGKDNAWRDIKVIYEGKCAEGE